MADLPFYTGEIAGYEIHMGRTYFSDGKINTAFRIFERSGEKVIDDGGGGGAVYGNVIGTYIHGIFDNDAEYNKLADVVRSNVDMDKLYDIIFFSSSERCG
jgi:adenosylcobyric acid synthase